MLSNGKPMILNPKQLRLCVYCGLAATTRDHVPSRCLLEKPYPPNLLTVPSCAACNRGFSKDEEYFLIALAQVGFTPTLMSLVGKEGRVYRALERNARLDDRIVQSLNAGKDNRVYFSPEPGRVGRVASKVALGLYVHRHKRFPRLDQFGPVEVHHHLESGLTEGVHFISTGAGKVPTATVNSRFEFKPWTIIQPDVFAYIFVRSWFRYGLSGKLTCLMVFYGTLLAAVGCPWPTGGRRNSHSNRDEYTMPLFDF